ncbi:primosomal replication protein [Acerihabitans sp. TG2]|uniref:primosomal replication protein n=1 Tax=Acerihabitans sp. TG2 TaxID=3096008 RepID=UPI002B22E5F7|nr:primosomal replication protein [Acerihabitans sp. TG2]MEA9390828.1 primosomal replication protein [Acerihabitans sp. TG2]
MYSSKLLTTLNDKLDGLAARITAGKHVNVEQSRFDYQLFQTRGHRLEDYLAESRETLQRLSVTADSGHADRVAWLAQRLIDQMTALARELATQDLRRQQPATVVEIDHYAKLSEHQDYERRLLTMIRDRDSLRQSTDDSTRQQQLQQEIAALEGRLSRCRQAVIRIERLIERRENGPGTK